MRKSLRTLSLLLVLCSLLACQVFSSATEAPLDEEPVPGSPDPDADTDGDGVPDAADGCPLETPGFVQQKHLDDMRGLLGN